MSLSDCIVCWNTPCECGHEYKDWSWERIHNLITVMIQAKTEQEEIDELDKLG
jgi:hypothetical protein